MTKILSSILTPLILVTLLLFSANSFAQQVPFADVPFDPANIPEPVPPPAAVRDFFELDPYYQQWINVRGYPVLASAEVSPYTVKEVAWTIGHMVAHRPDILKTMAHNRARFSIVPHNKHLSDIPEYDSGRLNFFWEIRARGVGGRITSSPEENIICGDRNYCYAEVIHEFAHQVHDYGLGNWGIPGVDPTFDKRLETLYNMAKKEGLYQNRYAGSNRMEYWAEGVGSWFNGPNRNSNVAHTRSALKEYDPRLAKLLTEVHGDGDWRYTPPATRTHLPHLQGFNPEGAPIYQRPARLLKLEAQLRDPNSDGDGKWVNLELHPPSQLRNLKALTTKGDRTDFIFVNLTGTDLSLYFFNVDGTKTLQQHSTTEDALHVITQVGVIWLIQDHTGKDFAVFRAEEQVGRVLILPASVPDNSPRVKMPDTNLAAAVRAELSLNPRAPITEQVMQRLRFLNLDDRGITHTTGLEYATQLEILLLGKNQIKNYAPLARLPKLKKLYLWANNISDLSVLPLLPKLELLDLNWNQIRDVNRLAGFTNLTTLMLKGNKISDVSPLTGLVNLEVLHLKGNPIQDTAVLTNLTKLHDVDIDIHQQSVPATGTWLAVEQPSGLSAANLVIKPGTFAIFVHKNQPPINRQADFHTYRLRSVLGAANFPNLADFFQNGGRIELVSHPSLNPLPPNTREPQFADVVISEIMWGLDSSDPGKQYIELYNTSAHTYSFANGDLMFRFSNASEKPLPAGIFTPPFNRNAQLKVIDKVDNKGWKVPGRSGNISQNQPLISMYRAIDYTTGKTPEGTIASSWKESTGRVNLSAPSYGTPGAAHLPPRPVVQADVNGDGMVNIQDMVLVASSFGKTGQNTADVNGDGVVNIADLVSVSSNFGKTGENPTDVNSDGIVNIVDLVKVAGEMGAAAPAAEPQTLAVFTAADVKQWLAQARYVNLTDATSQRGITFLEHLLAALTPKETALLANYPNPFNPETWIPYQLAKPADVSLTIYTMDGQVVRVLALGHQSAGVYQRRNRAAYWDGRNAVGETVASGLYFYTLTAGEFTATRKMLIRK